MSPDIVIWKWTSLQERYLLDSKTNQDHAIYKDVKEKNCISWVII